MVLGEPGQFITLLLNWKPFINDKDPIFCRCGLSKECAMPLLPISERYRLEFEETGIEQVRRRALQSLYSDEKLRHARDWLDDKDNAIARSAKKADRTVAIATMVAAVAAVIAVFVSLFWKPF
jgi:hypothetical protein